MANITASYHDITDAAGKLSHFEQQTQDILKQAQALVQNLVASGFVTDRASKAFDDSYAKFTQGAPAAHAGHERHGRVPEERRPDAAADGRAAGQGPRQLITVPSPARVAG